MQRGTGGRDSKYVGGYQMPGVGGELSGRPTEAEWVGQVRGVTVSTEGTEGKTHGGLG